MLDIIGYLESYFRILKDNDLPMKPNDQNSDGILYKFIQLREEAKRLSNETLSKNPILKGHIDYLVSFRNRITHDYDSVSYNYFNEIFDVDLPSLKDEIQKLVK